MSTDTDDTYSTLELRRMDEQTARDELSVPEWERWQTLTEMVDRAEQTRERWAEEDERVADIEVAAEMDQLGTEVDIYGNTLLVHVNSEDPHLQQIAEDIDAYRQRVGDVADEDDLKGLSESDADELADLLLEMLDTMIVEWGGTEWDELAPHQRQTILADARSKWGLDGLMLAWVDVIGAIEEDREERLDVVESFRQTERRGRR